MEQTKGALIVISGFSCVGKGKIVKELINKYNDYKISISATTRTPRKGEVDGREYFFISKEEFLDLDNSDNLLEKATYLDNYYGTPKSFVTEEINKGNNVILEIEIVGALQVKEKMNEAILIFVLPPSIEELLRRFEKRNTETPELIKARINKAKDEIKGINKYDYVIVNDDLDEAVETVNNIVKLQKNRPHQIKEFIDNINTQLNEL